MPVQLVPATKSQDVRFNQLEEGSNARIRYRKVSEATGEEVPNDRIRKGYEVSPGQYVVVGRRRDPFPGAPRAAAMIEIEDFVDLDDIDPLYFEQPYYLAPDPTALKPYQLLVEAMTELRKVAIGRVVMRCKESLVAIRPLDDVLCLETMRYADEVLPRSGLLGEDMTAAEPSERELAMARQLVESLSGALRARAVPRPVPRAAARAHRPQGRRRGDRRRTGRRGARGGPRPHGGARSEPGPGRVRGTGGGQAGEAGQEARRSVAQVGLRGPSAQAARAGRDAAESGPWSSTSQPQTPQIPVAGSSGRAHRHGSHRTGSAGSGAGVSRVIVIAVLPE